jgi:polysaccharide export outer membrane protein
MWRLIGILIFLSSVLSSCNINKDLMFKTNTEFVFDTLRLGNINAEFKFAPNDMFSFDVLTSEGNVIIEASSATQAVFMPSSRSVYNQYMIRPDGYAELPIVGEVLMSGLSISEAQDLLAEKYAQQLVNPYVVVRALNRRALVFNGDGSTGRVVGLLDNNTRLIEVIALGGGLARRANASKIKVIRKINGKDEIYNIDLSKIEGITAANMVIENGDVIYVTPTPDLMLGFTEEILPTVRLFSSILLLTIALERFN